MQLNKSPHILAANLDNILTKVESCISKCQLLNLSDEISAEFKLNNIMDMTRR